ncbi:hypothetical protein P7C73_g5123, partial [Tremellales sp. Uapishka_1]
SVVSTTSNHSASSHPAPPAAPSHHGLGTKGVSTFEKVISQTRPSWLPPKPREEDQVHYSQWSEMMDKSREHDKERRKLAEARRMEKEKRLAILTPDWEKLLGDGFTVAKVQSDVKLRRMWFEGIPSHLRGKAWALCIGNPLALSKDAYKSYVARSRRAITSGRFPVGVLDQIETDLDDTLVTLKVFGRGSPMRDDVKELLHAWMVARSDEGLGYAKNITQIAAMLLLSTSPAQAFLSLQNLLSRPVLRAFYTDTEDEIEAYYRVFENLQADAYPKIYATCKSVGLRVPEEWWRSLLVQQVSFEGVCRLWDQIVLDGDGYLFRAALAIFGFLEPRLYYPDREELLSTLEGRNPASLAIIAREKERARLKGEPWSEGVDGKLSVFGLDEERLFERLEEDGWRESRYERLVQRELPY